MKHFVISVFLTLMLALGAFAEGITVIILTTDEAQSVKIANDKLVEAQKNLDTLKNLLVNRHVATLRKEGKTTVNDFYVSEFWQFSADFRAMVPSLYINPKQTCNPLSILYRYN